MGDYVGEVRQQPKYSAFLATGGLVGLLTGVLLGVFGNSDPRYEATAALGYLGLICTGLGMLLGGFIAAVIDKRS